MAKRLEPFLQVNDREGFAAYSEGFHSHGGKIPKIKYISIGYPLKSSYEDGTFTVKQLARPTDNLNRLLCHVSNFMNECDKKCLNAAPHVLNDYYIEGLIFYEVGDRGVAEVIFGS